MSLSQGRGREPRCESPEQRGCGSNPGLSPGALDYSFCSWASTKDAEDMRDLFLTHWVSPSASPPPPSFKCCVGTSSVFLAFHAASRSGVKFPSSLGSAPRTSVALNNRVNFPSHGSLICKVRTVADLLYLTLIGLNVVTFAKHMEPSSANS